QRACGQGPGERVLAPARPDEKHVHAEPLPKTLEKAATLGRCVARPHVSLNGSRTKPGVIVAETADNQTRQGSNLPEFSVSELSAAIKGTLERAYGYVRLRGEISGFRGRHASGHCYFALKDDKARIEAVIWRSTLLGLRIKPAEGLEVIATGRVT